MIYFAAPYEDRDEILRLGAKWEFSNWRWCVEDRENYAKFSKWLEGSMISDELFILGAEVGCPDCGKKTEVAALAVGKYTENFENKVYGENELNILYGFENISGGLAEYLVKNFPVKKRFYEPYGYKYLVNGCKKCDKIISDESLFCEENSPFFINSEKKVNNLKIVKVNFEGDVALNAKIKLSFNRTLFENLPLSGEIDIKF